MKEYCFGCTFLDEDEHCNHKEKCQNGELWEPPTKGGFGKTCPFCNCLHGRPPAIGMALDILMDETNDGQCRLSARNYIMYMFRKYMP